MTHCGKCTCDVTVGGWLIHLKSEKHCDNESDY
jgi:hypothetical protein